MRRYAITEGLGVERALVFVEHNLKRGVEMIQIREKQLAVEELRWLVERVMSLTNPQGTRIFVNGLADFGAHGVHLPAALVGHALACPLPPHGASCHSREEVELAAHGGAEFVVFGPVFATRGKTGVGLDALRGITRDVAIPIYALGGVTAENAALCMDAGAAGIAGISLFRP